MTCWALYMVVTYGHFFPIHESVCSWCSLPSQRAQLHSIKARCQHGVCNHNMLPCQGAIQRLAIMCWQACYTVSFSAS